MADELVSSFYQLPATNEMKRKYEKSPIIEIQRTNPLKYNLDHCEANLIRHEKIEMNISWLYYIRLVEHQLHNHTTGVYRVPKPLAMPVITSAYPTTAI